MKKISIVISCLFILIAVFVFMTARTYPGASNGALGPGFFPMVLSGIMVLLSVLLVVNIRKEKDEPLNLFNRKNAIVLISIAIITAYVILLNVVGFVIATPLFLFTMMRYFKLTNWKLNACISLLTMGVLYGVFTTFLSVQLPGGILF